jgi:hypothetical protein
MGKHRGKSNYAINHQFAAATAGFYRLEQDYIFVGPGGFGAFARTFNSNPLSVPSE